MAGMAMVAAATATRRLSDGEEPVWAAIPSVCRISPGGTDVCFP